MCGSSLNHVIFIADHQISQQHISITFSLAQACGTFLKNCSIQISLHTPEQSTGIYHLKKSIFNKLQKQHSTGSLSP